jgi:hypothetical protein
VIATAFGQLADEGKIDCIRKAVCAVRALKCGQEVWGHGFQPGWAHAGEYLRNLARLMSALARA